MHDKEHGPILELYKALLKTRLNTPACENSERANTVVEPLDDSALLLIRDSSSASPLVVLFNFKDCAVCFIVFFFFFPPLFSFIPLNC